MRRLLSPRWILAHLLVLVLAAGCLLLCWWQVNRAAEGNLLSYGYAVEWPVFGGFLIFVWIKEMRRALRSHDADALAATGAGAGTTGDDGPARSGTRRPARVRNEAAYDDSDDPALAAYNHYLAWLNANPHASRADYPGAPTTAAQGTIIG